MKDDSASPYRRSLKKALVPEAQTLGEYIASQFGGSQRRFAEAQGVAPPQVTQWLKKEFIVVDDRLYSPRRILNT
ncbi:MAG: hypothetical protein ACK5MR_18205 [Cumulibacter sp.]